VPPVVGENLERRRTEMLVGIEFSKPYPVIAEEKRLFLHCIMLEAVLDNNAKEISFADYQNSNSANFGAGGGGGSFRRTGLSGCTS
jgi:hypothetical protein